MSPEDIEVIGPPPEHTTHFNVFRLTERGNERLSASNAEGVRRNSWPLADCGLEFVRKNWGPGRYRVMWAREIDGRQVRHGWAREFGFEQTDAPDAAIGDEERDAGDPFVQADKMRRRAIQDARADMMSMLSMAREMAAAAIVQRPAASPEADEENRRLRSELEQLRAEARVREVAEQLRRDHQAELAVRDTRLAALERQVHEAELVRPDDEGPPQIDFTEKIMPQVLAAAAQAVMRKPEILQGLLEAVATLAKAAVTPAPQPAAVPAPQAAPVAVQAPPQRVSRPAPRVVHVAPEVPQNGVAADPEASPSPPPPEPPPAPHDPMQGSGN